MEAGLLWCCSVILGFIGCLRTCQTVRVASEPRFDPIGEEHTTQSSIDSRVGRGRRFAHGGRLERLPAAQQFAIDLGDRFYDLAGSGVVGDELAYLSVRFLRRKIYYRLQSWVY